MAAVEPSSSQETLAWEARHGRGAALAAGIAAAGIFIGTVWRGITLQDLPRTGALESLARLTEPGKVGELESLRTDTFAFFDSNATGVLLASCLVAIGYVALGWALTYLAVATRARRPEFPRLILYVPAFAGAIQGVATLVSAFGTNRAISDFLSGSRTVESAEEIAGGGLVVFGQILGLPGSLGLALALVMISLNAMRAGLLTRFMGVLGMIAGALQILPLGGPLPVVQCFWLVMLAALLLGHWPRGVPPAWQTGKAEPWPSSADLRAERQKAIAARRGLPAEPEPAPHPVPAGAPSPATSARKRKRKKR